MLYIRRCARQSRNRAPLCLALIAMLWLPEAAAAIPTSPAPSQVFAPTLAFNSNSNNSTTGDPEVVLGKAFAIVKANEQIQYIERNADGSLGTPDAPINDTTFWGTTAKDATPGNTSNTVTITGLRGDARVYYDPYGANDMLCEIGGRFLVTELAELQVNGTIIGGTVLAISASDDPTQPWDMYAIYDSSAACPQNDEGFCPGDQPRLGFNTNWIVIWTNYETVNRTAGQLFVTSKHDAECNGITASQIMGGMSNLVAPAITYQTNGQDLDGSTLYFVSVASDSSGSLNVYQMTGTPTNATFNSTPIYTPHTLVNGGWNGLLPSIQQNGGTKIAPGNGDDRFTAVVVRNHAIWAAQTIGLPASSPTNTAVQWWQITIDTNSSSDGTVADQERAGGHSPSYNGMDGNANDAGLAVNAAGDQLVSYSEIPYNSSTGSYGYLGAGYTFESHSDCQEAFGPQTYEPGLGVFPNTPFPPPRTGDYTAASVDPIDDNGFITGAAYAGSLYGSNYYWTEAVAMVQPAQPPQPTFVAHALQEDECNTTQTSCPVTLTIPSGVEPTDTTFVVVVSGQSPNALSLQLPSSAWTRIPVANASAGTNPYNISASDNCFSTTGWVVARTGAKPPQTPTFTVPEVPFYCGGTEYANETAAFLLDYKNACTKITNPFNGASNFVVKGYPINGDGTTISTNAVTMPDNTTLLDVFMGGAECPDTGENNLVCPSFGSISGFPTLSVETPLNPFFAFLAADRYSGKTNGSKWGGYSVDDNWSSPNLGWHILVGPY